MAGGIFTLGIGGCLVSGYTENLGLVLVVVENLICSGVDNLFTVQAAQLVIADLVHFLGVR